jgi:hypothetical protein
VSVLHCVRWRRIILDEAHCIKDRRSSTAHAVFALPAKYRWALSGTPLQVGPPAGAPEAHAAALSSPSCPPPPARAGHAAAFAATGQHRARHPAPGRAPL